MECLNIFSEKFQRIVNGNIHNVVLNGNVKEEFSSVPDRVFTKNENSWSCSYCNVEFPDLQTQREHYKLDWHRYNLKQSLLVKPSINEEEFNVKTVNDDLSSISGSDSEKEDTLDMYATAQGKIFLQNDQKQVFSIYRCLLLDRKEEISDDSLTYRLKVNCLNNTQWTMLMLGGGHFAGAVFQGNTPIIHKTFHCYVVRAGQGSSQSARDGKSSGSHPKSAGSSLRRYNEMAMVQHIKSILENWKTEIEKSSLIIYRATGTFNRSVLFGGSVPVLERTSKKLRTIPFSTRRPTFTELKRVHGLLSTAEVYNSLVEATETFTKQKFSEADIRRNKIRLTCINRAKSREVIERPLPTALSAPSDPETNLPSKEQQESFMDEQLLFTDVDIILKDLQEFDDSLKPQQRKHLQRKKKVHKKNKNKKLREQQEARNRELIEIISGGQIDRLKNLVENHINLSEAADIEADNSLEAFINKIVDDNSNTLLHIAAMNEQIETIQFLMENNADPCLKNKSHETAYSCTQSKEIRELFRQFAKDYPDKFNYNKALIPTNALTNDELAEKRKVQRKIKKEKEKVKKKEGEIKRKEDEEKQRFLQLSDREKRALAAERRILSQSGIVICRCFLCAADIAGKVPFEYMGNLFCTIECLKAHRLQHPQDLRKLHPERNWRFGEVQLLKHSLDSGLIII